MTTSSQQPRQRPAVGAAGGGGRVVPKQQHVQAPHVTPCCSSASVRQPRVPPSHSVWKYRLPPPSPRPRDPPEEPQGWREMRPCLLVRGKTRAELTRGPRPLPHHLLSWYFSFLLLREVSLFFYSEKREICQQKVTRLIAKQEQRRSASGPSVFNENSHVSTISIALLTQGLAFLSYDCTVTISIIFI